MFETMNEVYFHEDDYCQQEVLPLAAMEFCLRQIAQIDDFATAHQAPDGAGWTEMFVRDSSPETLVSLGIPIARLREAVAEHLPEVPLVYTGYGSHKELCRYTTGFGLDEACIVFASWNKEGVVTSIWTELFTADVKKRQLAVDSLQRLGRQYSLLYVDWAWGFATALDQSSDLLTHIEAKLAEIARRMEPEG